MKRILLSLALLGAVYGYGGVALAADDAASVRLRPAPTVAA
jgi:uncharacterized membrane protein YtjA (UPF0391 family)